MDFLKINLEFFGGEGCNSFTEIEFTYHTIHLFKVYNSTGFSAFVQSRKHLHNKIPSIFISPRGSPALKLHPQPRPPPSHWQRYVTFLLLNLSDKQKNIIQGLSLLYI